MGKERGVASGARACQVPARGRGLALRGGGPAPGQKERKPAGKEAAGKEAAGKKPLVDSLCPAPGLREGPGSQPGARASFRLPAPGPATGAPTRRAGSRAPSSTGSAHSSPKGLLSASAAGPGKGGLPRPTPDRPPGPEPEGAAEPHHKNSSASFCPGSAPRLGANTRTEKLPKRSRWQPVRIRINSF